MPNPTDIKLRSLKPAKLFSVLNLDYPGLEEVKRAVEAGDRGQALAALLAYYRRKYPLPDPPPRLDAKTRQLADDAAQGIFQFLGYSPIKYEQPIDWEQDPHDDIEWVACVYRFQWARPLAAAFAATRDEKYAQAFVDLTTDWIAKHPLEQHERTHRTLTHWKGFAWLDIQTGIRASSLCMAFPILIHAQAFTPQFLAILLASFYDHQVKSELLPMTIYHNKALMELNGYMEIAAMLPEFRDQPHWIEVGHSRLYDKLQGQVTNDGVQREWSFGYHWHVLSDAVSVMEILDRAGIRPSDELRIRLHAMYEFLFGIATPELGTPMFGDTSRELPEEADRKSRLLYGALLKGSALFDEPKYTALANLDPSQLSPCASFAWREAGLYVMRNEWGPQQVYFALHDSPPAISSHDQDDNGTFELYAYGRWLMTDSGYYTYGHDKVARAWHRQTAVHQTLTFNGENSRSLARHRLWVVGPDFDAVCVDNASYDGLIHRRTIWFPGRRFFVILDEAIGEAKGVLDLHFQFAPGSVKLDAARKRAYTLFDDANVLVWMDPVAPVTLEEEEGWTGWYYNKRMRRTACRFRHSASGAPAHFLTLLVPCRGDKVPPVQAGLIGLEDLSSLKGRVEITLDLLGQSWQVGYDLAQRRAWCETKQKRGYAG